MQADYIRREDAVGEVEFGITLASAINIVTGERTELFQRENDELRDAVKRIEALPAADVAPVVHGRWEKKKDSDLFYCSECGLPSMHKWPYCERCGAKMDGGDEHE